MSASEQALLESRWLYELHRRGRRRAPAAAGRARGGQAQASRGPASRAAAGPRRGAEPQAPPRRREPASV